MKEIASTFDGGAIIQVARDELYALQRLERVTKGFDEGNPAHWGQQIDIEDIAPAFNAIALWCEAAYRITRFQELIVDIAKALGMEEAEERTKG